MAFETRSGMPYNPYFDDPYFQLAFPPAAYRKGLADFADMKASDADRLRKAMMPNVPSSLDYFDDDPARMIQNQFQQYRDREPVAPPTRPQSVRPPSPAVQSRQMAGPPQQAQGPANPPRDTSPFNYNIPAAPKTSAVKTAGLLDTEDAPESGSSWYDDPMRMGLIQAGLGLLSAPQYSTNMNDVAFFPTAARGIGGFLQGYAGTKQRLAEEERQKLEDEYKRSQIEFDKLYKTALTNEAIGRTEQMQRLLEQPAKDQKEWERRVRKVYPGENNETAEILIAAGYQQGPALLDKIGIKKPANETQRTELLNQIKKNDILSDTEKKTLIEMANERNAKGELRNSYTEVEEQIKKKVEAKQPKTPTAPKLSDNERILLQSEGRTPEAEIAFGNEYTVPVDRQTRYNDDGSQTVIPIYKEIPKFIRKKYPELTSQADQIRAQAKESTKRPPQAVLEAQGQVDELRKIEATIQAEGADIPLTKFDQISNEILDYVPFGNYAQDEDYRKKLNLQNEWIISILRQESGAAIGQDEYKNYRAIYFPMAGDSEAMRKAERRLVSEPSRRES